MEESKPPGRKPSTANPERGRSANSCGPRYPKVHVELHSRNPYAVVSAVRLALRRSRIERAEIKRFTEEAFAAGEPRKIRQVCDSWAEIEYLA